MKKLLSVALALVLLLSLAACGGKVPEEENVFSGLEPVTLVGADSASEGSAGQLFGQYFAQRVSDLTEGRLTVDYHPGGALGGDLELLRQAQANQLQVVVCQTAPMVSLIPEMAVFDLPMVFAEYDGDAIDRVLNGENEFSARLSDAYEKAGFHSLGFLQDATYRLTTANRPLTALEDFRGLRIRTMENENHRAFWSALGAEPESMPWAEVYAALQSGRVEAQENAPDTCYGASLQDVQSWLACTNHVLYCNQLCISKEAWDSLAPAYREAIRQAAAEAVAYMRPLMEEIDAYHKQKLAESGMGMIEYDSGFYDSVLALEGVQAVYDDIDNNQTGGLGSLLMAQLRESAAR